MRITPLIGLALAMAATAWAQDEAALDAVPRAYADMGWFMGSVLVARDDEILLSKGYGLADLDRKIANQPATKFRIGSLTKQFTAAAVLLLEEQGRLSVDDPVKKYLPNVPAAWDKITIFHLLTHTSGIPNYTGFPEYDALKTRPTTPRELVARFRDKPLEFEPGMKGEYSNSGYALLGLLLETVSGESYAAFVRKHIFAPLGMADSGYDPAEAPLPHRASGYQPGPDGPRPADPIDMTIPYAAGALFSTTLDLLKWEQGLFGERLLSAASLKKMLTPFKHNYAFGVGVGTKNGARLVGHAGGVDGFSSFLLRYPDEKLTIVVLGNLAGGQAEKVALSLGDRLHGEPVLLPVKRTAISVPVETLQRYAGVYELNPQFLITVTVEDGKLHAQATNQPKFVLAAEAEEKFFLEVADAQLEFTSDDSGVITGLILRQAGHDQPAKRR